VASILPLRIKPVKVKQSVYLRVPNDIADWIGIDPDAEITLNIEQKGEGFLLLYSVRKSSLRSMWFNIDK